MLEAWVEQLAVNAPYIVLALILLASGFGLPIPEDIPLIVGGYLAGHGYADPIALFLVCFTCIMIADAALFWMGRACGHHVPKLPILNRFVTDEHVARAEKMLERHGGKFIFVARFVPGLRAPAMFGAGALRVPYWKFIVFDGGAALLTAPLFFFLAYRFADTIEYLRLLVLEFQVVVMIAAILGLIGYLCYRWWHRPRVPTG